MKNIFKYICAAIVFTLTVSCNPYNDWPDGESALEHVYYFSVVKTGNVGSGANSMLEFEIAADGTARHLRRIFNVPTEIREWVESGEPYTTNPIPFRFISERTRSYNVTTFFWITQVNPSGTFPNFAPIVPATLVPGVDFTVHTADGTLITPNAQGAYSINWANAEKGEQGVKIKRLTTATGALMVNTLDSSKFTGTGPDRTNLETLINNKTNDYLIRGLWFDWNAVRVRFF
jgi:hypothetical protein